MKTKPVVFTALALLGMALLFVGILYLAMPVPAGWGHPVLAMLSCGLVALAVKPWLRADRPMGR